MAILLSGRTTVMPVWANAIGAKARTAAHRSEIGFWELIM
jgi:hypothetical protein